MLVLLEVMRQVVLISAVTITDVIICGAIVVVVVIIVLMVDGKIHNGRVVCETIRVCCDVERCWKVLVMMMLAVVMLLLEMTVSGMMLMVMMLLVFESDGCCSSGGILLQAQNCCDCEGFADIGAERRGDWIELSCGGHRSDGWSDGHVNVVRCGGIR